MIKEEFVLTRWHYKNRVHYESLGYIYPGKNSELIVKSTELMPNSTVIINAICESCLKERNIQRNDYSKICKDCALKNTNIEKRKYFADEELSKKTREKQSESRKKFFRDNPEEIIKCATRAKNDYHLKLGTKENRERASKQCKRNNTGKFGKNHPGYNPNLTDEERNNKRAYDEYYRWKSNIYSRDKVCQCCLIKFKNKNGTRCHHLDGYKENSEIRHDVNNGILLCDPCHKGFHRIYGLKNITRDKFFEWMSANFMHNFSSLEEILEFNKICKKMK